jgi:uncharacterized protein (TIGR00725 family)
MKTQRRRVIGVVGAGRADEALAAVARDVGRLLAEAGCVLLCGGRGGVMAAAAQGAAEAGGEAIGLLPGRDAAEANPYLTIVLPTGLGEARNCVIAQASEALIAVGGGHGTLSEIAFALKVRKRVVGLGSWDIPGVEAATDPAAALRALGL